LNFATTSYNRWLHHCRGTSLSNAFTLNKKWRSWINVHHVVHASLLINTIWICDSILFLFLFGEMFRFIVPTWLSTLISLLNYLVPMKVRFSNLCSIWLCFHIMSRFEVNHYCKSFYLVLSLMVWQFLIFDLRQSNTI